MVISFLLFLTAAYLNICETKLYSPPKILSSEPMSIIEEPKDEVSTTTEVVEIEKNKNTNNETVKKADNTTKKVEVKEQPRTDTRNIIVASDPNDELRTNMESTYSIDIKYGDEVKGYSVGGMNVYTETNDTVINKALNKLNNDLSLYPSGMLNEVQDSSKLSIYLVRNYSKKTVTGVTDSTGNPIIISISTERDFDDTVHHELYHYFEKYMTSKGASYTSWNSLNPTTFNYGSTDTSLVYSKTLSPDAFFVNVYSQTNAAEDRASTFEYMMASSKASCLNIGNPVNKKATYMSNMMDYYINSCSSSTIEYWERYL
jgi:hypothetical protein